MKGEVDIYDQLGFSKEHAMVLGSFAIVASSIEYYIELILLGLIGADQRHGGATIRWVSKQQQITMIRKILPEIYGEESEICKQMKQCLDDAVYALDRRHEYIHSLYYIKPEDSYRRNLKRGKFDIPNLDIDLDMMQVDLTQATVAMDKLGQAAIRLDLPFPVPSHYTQTEQSPNQEDTQDQNTKEPSSPHQSSEE